MSSEERKLGEALLIAAEHEIWNITNCLTRGTNINYQNKNGQTALHITAGRWDGKAQIVKLLIDYGIDLDLQDKDGSTVLHKAAENGHTDIVRLLIENSIDVNIQNKNGHTALHIIASAWHGNAENVKMLIDAGVDINLQCKDGSTVLHKAAENGHTDIVRLLIENSIAINIQNKDSLTALHVATNEENIEIAGLLIDNDIDVNLQTMNGQTALHIIASTSQESAENWKMLIDVGFAINLQDNEGNTALHVASMNDNKEIVTYLIEVECDPNKRNIKGKRPMEVANNETVVKLIQDYENTLLPGLPIEVKKLDKESARVFTSLLEEESYPHFESRVMLAGEQATGKTTIARYLVGKRPTRLRKSTDGIELYNGLSYMDRDTKEWLQGQQDFSLEEITVSRSLSHEENFKLLDTMPSTLVVSNETDFESLASSQRDLTHKSSSFDAMSTTKSYVTESENIKILSDQINMNRPLSGYNSDKEVETPNYKDTCNTNEQDNYLCSKSQSDRLLLDGESSDGCSHRNDYPAVRTKTALYNHRKLVETTFKKVNTMTKTDGAGSMSGCTDEMLIETVSKRGTIKKLKTLFGVTKYVKEIKVSISKEKFLKKSLKAGKKMLHNKKIAPIIIWDFGGQDVFYSTHQTFLTYRAIYIIAMDGSRQLDDPCPNEHYLPGKSGYKTARDYLLFWINTIVTYCKGINTRFPKIMVVLTHKDLVKTDEVEKRRHELFADISQMFETTPLMYHLVIDDKIFVNAKDKYDPEMEKIKKIIIRESERQPTWGESLPKCFIPLELEFASLIRRNIHLINLEHLMKINALQPIRPLSETELKVFLKFQHSIGKVLYFDEQKLDKHIILSPTHLIDAFKSIVTDRRFCEGDREREKLWDVLDTKGVVSKKAIYTVWRKNKYRKFNENKDYLLDVMTHLDILVEPKRYDFSRTRIPADFYYVASMVRAIDDSGYLQSASITKRNIALAFQTTSLMIPPALSFRFISYCLSVWAVKTYGQTNREMLFHRSGVFTIDPSLDMYILCEDDKITIRLVHARTNTLIMRDLASSINECLTSALEKISQLYTRTSSDQNHTSDASFVTSVCCNSPEKPCIVPFDNLVHIGKIWKCPAHGIEHPIHMIKSWIHEKQEEGGCEPGCPVTNEEFLTESPTDLHLRRLSLLYSSYDVRDLAIYLGLSTTDIDNTVNTGDPTIWNFEVIRQCRDSYAVTFKEIKRAIVAAGKGNIHTLCKLVKGDFIDFEREPEKWDVVPTEEHIDRLVPLVGNKSLPFLIELGMDFHTWERISHKQNERDLVRLNKDILEEWSNKFCRMHSLKPTLRSIAQSFNNIGKNVKIVENTLLDLF